MECGLRPGTVVGEYVLIKIIGEGSSGYVIKAMKDEPIISSPKRYALKFLLLKTQQSTFQREVRYLNHFRGSSNIVNIVESFVWKEFGVIVQELLTIDLLDYIESEFSPHNKIIFKQICLAIKSLHDNNIAHLDLKPENILLNDYNCVKIADFGTCLKYTEKTKYFGPVGTKFYCAPEIVCILFFTNLKQYSY